jgi:hypothetical protein
VQQAKHRLLIKILRGRELRLRVRAGGLRPAPGRADQGARKERRGPPVPQERAEPALTKQAGERGRREEGGLTSGDRRELNN